jgi:hypothetical protein
MTSHGKDGGIGTWGEGFKIAIFSLGSEVEIVTHFPGDEPVFIHFDKDWLYNPDWNVPVYAAHGATEPGRTRITIRYLQKEITWPEVIRDLGLNYGHKISAIYDAHASCSIEFAIDGAGTKKLRPLPLAHPTVIQASYSFPPGFEPRLFMARRETEHSPLDCKFLIALTPKNSPTTSGVTMYGNGRMFARALRTAAVGYGEWGLTSDRATQPR